MSGPSKTQVNKAGDILREWWVRQDASDPPDLSAALETMLAFRAGFQQPLTKVVMSMRSFMRTEQLEVIVAQRLKRGPTILDKLCRHPRMQLARMHDIGGCRAIVPAGDFAAITRLRTRIDRSVNEVVRVDDYITEPKATGYRAVHVVVRRDAHLIEIQLRTARQHAWADFVERLGASTGFDLKDGQGPEELLDYLRVGASIMTMQELDQDIAASLWAEWRGLTEVVAPYLSSREEG